MEKIYVFHHKIYSQIDPHGTHRLIYMLQECVAGPLRLSVVSLMYSIKEGEDPALYIGFGWYVCYILQYFGSTLAHLY